MAFVNITSKMAIHVNVKYENNFDPHADFEQIVLRIRKENDFINIRVVDCGDAVCLEFFSNNKKTSEFKLRNEPFNQNAIHQMIEIHLN